MGCASSSPMLNGSGMVDAAKHAASDVKHAGEGALNDVGDSVNGTVGQVKDAVVGAVHGIGQGLDGVMHSATDGAKGIATEAEARTAAAVQSAADTVTEYTHIPLRDPNKMDEHLEEFKETLLKKAQSFSDDTEQLADDLIKDTEDVVADTTDNVKSTTVDALDAFQTLGKQSVDGNDETTSIHSLDSLRTTSPEPEIEKALSNVDTTRKQVPSPVPTFNEMTEIAGGGDGVKESKDEESNAVQQNRRNASQHSSNRPTTDGDKVLIEKYTKFFTTSNPSSAYTKYGNHSYPLDTGDILGLMDTSAQNDGNGGTDMSASEMGEERQDANGPMKCTQWELLADAILATPVTRFVEPTMNLQPVIEIP